MKNTPPDAASKVVSYKKAAEISRRLKQQGKKIVFKTGCFDIFHIAHARALQHSKGLGDVLFVGVGSDKTLRALKGSDRPIFPEKYRAELVASLECVDYVVILKEPLKGRIDHGKILSLVRPHYYMLPPDDKGLPEKRKMADKYGIEIKFKPQMKSEYTGTIISSADVFSRLKKWD
mgnify:CR=1 FL=1